MSSARSLAVLAILLHAAASAHAAAEAPAAAFRAGAIDVNFVRVNKFFGPVSPVDVASAFAKLPSFEDNLQPLTSLLTPPVEAGPAAAPLADSGRKKGAEVQAEEDTASAVSALSSLSNEISTPSAAAVHEGPREGKSDDAASAGGRVAGNAVISVAVAGFAYLVTF